MSKQNIDMTWKEFERLAKKSGFHFKKHGKKHDEYYNPETDQSIQIERHWSTEVRPKLLKSLLKAIGR